MKPAVAERILTEVRDALSRWPDWATEAGVSAASKAMVASAIDEAPTAP